MGSGHANNHSAIHLFYRNTKFSAFILFLPPPKGDLIPDLSDKNFVILLLYSEWINKSHIPPRFHGVFIALSIGAHFSLDNIVTNSLSKAVSNFFKPSIMNCNWRGKKKYIFCMPVWSKNIQHVSTDSTRHCSLLTAQPITYEKCKELLTGNLYL